MDRRSSSRARRCGCRRSSACPCRRRCPCRARPRRSGGHARLTLRVRRVGAGHELEELHVADRVEEVHHEEALRETPRERPCIMSAMRRPLVFEATIARACASFSSFSKSARLGSSCSMMASMTRSQSCELLEVVLDVADRDEARAARVEERGGPRLERLLEPAGREPRCGRRLCRPGGTMSRSRTWMPALARWAAMPLPMTPAPMTATRRIGGVRVMEVATIAQPSRGAIG